MSMTTTTTTRDRLLGWASSLEYAIDALCEAWENPTNTDPYIVKARWGWWVRDAR